MKKLNIVGLIVHAAAYLLACGGDNGSKDSDSDTSDGTASGGSESSSSGDTGGTASGGSESTSSGIGTTSATTLGAQDFEGACEDLEACCQSLPSGDRSTCENGYDSVQASGDIGCYVLVETYRQLGKCS